LPALHCFPITQPYEDSPGELLGEVQIPFNKVDFRKVGDRDFRHGKRHWLQLSKGSEIEVTVYNPMPTM
jgi:hypothetical protein